MDEKDYANISMQHKLQIFNIGTHDRNGPTLLKSAELKIFSNGNLKNNTTIITPTMPKTIECKVL